MCRDGHVKRLVIQAAKKDCNEVYKVVEDNVDLVGLVRVKGQVAEFYDVERDGMCRKFRTVRFFDPTYSNIKRVFKLGKCFWRVYPA